MLCRVDALWCAAKGGYLRACEERVQRAFIYRQYRSRELKYPVSNYMHTQPQINATMRSILVDWMVDVREEFGLLESSLFLSIRLLDRLLHTVPVPRKELQLAGSACILVAAYVLLLSAALCPSAPSHLCVLVTHVCVCVYICDVM